MNGQLKARQPNTHYYIFIQISHPPPPPPTHTHTYPRLYKPPQKAGQHHPSWTNHLDYNPTSERAAENQQVTVSTRNCTKHQSFLCIFHITITMHKPFILQSGLSVLWWLRRRICINMHLCINMYCLFLFWGVCVCGGGGGGKDGSN